MEPEFIKAEPKTLRELGYDERWLQARIFEDPSILGLGDLTVLERERSQPTGGRIDFLMSDPEEGVRYEIEVMLGRTDESHIIRTIEYWDIERTKSPQLEHRAVIVAEEITNRFFNVIRLLNRAVPMIAIQLSVLQVNDRFVLNFTKILDVAELYAEEEELAGDQVDRSYWEKRSNPNSLMVVDKLVSIVAGSGNTPRVTYNKGHIALGTVGRNFAWFNPRKIASHCHVVLLLGGEQREKWVQKLDDVGIFAGPRGNEMKMRIGLKELQQNEALIGELLAVCEDNSKS